MSVTAQNQIHVLHVDDNPEVTDRIATYLEREDNRLVVETATCADEGLQLLADRQIDCIVSDYKMPGMNGIEFLKAVTEHQCNLPFILYTGKGSEEVASEAISAGVTDYIEKKSDTDDYALLLNRVIDSVTNQRREQRIEFLETLETELTELSIDFLRTNEYDIDNLIDRTLEKIGVLVNADRSYVFNIDSAANTLSNTHEWCSEGTEPQIDMLQNIPQDTLPWWIEKLEAFENIVIPTVSELPPEAVAVQELLQEQNIKSLIVTPMVSNDELVGFVGFDWVEEQQPWSDEFINTLRMTSELITTARKREQREQELRELTDRLDLAVTGANLGVWDWNIQTDSVTFNEQWAEMLGLSLDEIEPTIEAWKQRVHPEDIEEVNAALAAHLSGETEYYDTEHRMQTAVGEWKWIRDIGQVAERDEDGEPIRAVGIHIDITKKKRQRQELEKSETIIQALTDAVYVVDEGGRFTYVNDEFVELVGYDKERILGSTPSLIKGENAIERAEQQLARLLSSDGPETTTFEITVHTRDGDSVICEDHMAVLPYDGDKFNGSVGTLRDVTKRKERQQQLELADRVLRHNVRNDMNVIRGRANLIYDNASGNNAKHANHIMETSKKLIDTTETERKMAKLFNDSTDPISVDVAPLLRQVTTNIRAEFPKATITISCPDGIKIRAKNQFRQGIKELLTNAIIHNPDDSPKVKVAVTKAAETIQIRIIDNGPRIPEMEREVLLGNKKRTQLDHGSGLGLWFVQLLVSRSGGSIRFEQNPSTGNTVILELPEA